MNHNVAWLEREEAVLSSGMRLPFYPLVIKEAKGEYIYDYDGNQWIDFLSSACVINTGHGHPDIVARMKQQMDQLVHYNPAYASHEQLITLAENLVQITPGDFSKKVTFGLSGADANDSAMKLARSYTKRSKIIAFTRSYHGNTYGALSASAVSLPMRRGMGPVVPDVYHIPFPDPYRPAFDAETESGRCMQALEHLFETTCPPEEVAAIMIEPIQGDSGVIVPEQAYIDSLKKICKEHDILIIADEVQTGFGRTGKWFGSEHIDLEPDLLVLGKGIASGMPLSAVVGRSEIMMAWDAPSGAFSLAANPLSCVAAQATIDIIEQEQLVDRAATLGAYMKERFLTWQERFDFIGDVRGEGCMLGIDLVKDRTRKERNHTVAAKVSWRCWETGLFLTFFSGSVLRIAPPLTISDEALEDALAILEGALEDVAMGRVPDSVLEHVQGW